MKRYITTILPIVLVIVALTLVYAAFDPDEVDSQATNFTGLIIDGNSATATPAFIVDQSGAGVLAEFRDSATPVARFPDGGGLTVVSGGLTVTAGGQTITAGGQTITAGGQTITAGAVSFPVNQEHIGVMSVITSTVPYTPASGTVATVGAGELWLIHKVFIKTDTNFDCTGDNCTLQIGDGNDANGFISAVDANLQTTFTEATGYTAGYYGIEAGSGGAYTLDDGGPFVYAATDTIDYAIGGTDPAAGSATAYVLYTRVY